MNVHEFLDEYIYVLIYIYIQVYIQNGSFSVEAPAARARIYIFIYIYTYIYILYTSINVHAFTNEYIHICIYRMEVSQWRLQQPGLGADCRGKYRIRVSLILVGR
jgi:hypothetical protein